MVLRGTCTINYIRPCVRYFDNVREELKIHFLVSSNDHASANKFQNGLGDEHSRGETSRHPFILVVPRHPPLEARCLPSQVPLHTDPQIPTKVPLPYGSANTKLCAHALLARRLGGSPLAASHVVLANPPHPFLALVTFSKVSAGRQDENVVTMRQGKPSHTGPVPDLLTKVPLQQGCHKDHSQLKTAQL